MIARSVNDGREGMVRKPPAPPPLPHAAANRASAPAQARPSVAPPPVFRGRPAGAVPPPIVRRPQPRAHSAQAFASFSNRVTVDTAKPAPAGDELVPLGNGGFGARSGDRGLVTRPDGTYNFVRTQGLRRMDQRTLISAKAGHAQLSSGKPVVYAGTLSFSGGALDWWSNFSGHYQPVAAFRAQAQLPLDRFVPWQELQMRGTSMQRRMFRDRRAGGAPAADGAKSPGNDNAEAEPQRGGSPSSARQTAPSGATPAAASAVPARSGQGRDPRA
jgi:hypothetical protein